MRVSDPPRCEGCCAVYALRDSRTNEILKFGETNLLRRRRFANFIGGLVVTVVNSDSTLASWNGITSSVNQINANVYNAAAFVSPLLSSTKMPRLLLLSGQAFTNVPPGALSNTVYYNNAP